MSQILSEFVGFISEVIRLGTYYRDYESKYTVAVEGVPNKTDKVKLGFGNFLGKSKIPNYTNLVLYINTRYTKSYPVLVQHGQIYLRQIII
jgi:hypothetical protein